MEVSLEPSPQSIGTPVLGLIGPTQRITAGNIQVDFTSFYKTFFQTGSLKDAIGALTSRTASGFYFRTTARQFFYDVWASYKCNACSKEQIGIRVRRMYREAKAQNLQRTPSIGQLKRKIKNEERRSFKKFRDAYFMYDINPSNVTRFPATYPEADAYALRLQRPKRRSQRRG
ncbi:MAG: hypothetical protein H0T67_11225 [Burkholderiaceae bacterium]|nr:hypothetical protein [Burkholderiaceae bacterium]